MKNTTKRFPVSVAFESYSPKRIEFLVLFIEGAHGDNFMGLETGSEVPFGSVSYVGKDVSVADILNKMVGLHFPASSSDAAKAVLTEYIKALQEFRIGNVIRIEYQPNGEFTLHKVADRPPPRRQHPRLP